MPFVILYLLLVLQICSVLWCHIVGALCPISTKPHRLHNDA